jgi:ribosomal protein L31E
MIKEQQKTASNDTSNDPTKVAQSDAAYVKPDTLRKRAQRAREKAKTEAGRKMANSQIVVDKNEAMEILQERGLRSRNYRVKDHIRKTIYQLAEEAASALRLPGPNYHLLRYGYLATKYALENPAYGDLALYAIDASSVENPYESPDGELLTNLELRCMMDMQMWKPDFPHRPTKEEAARHGEEAVDELVRSGEVTPEYAAQLKEAGQALQTLADRGIGPEQAFVSAAIELDLSNLLAEEAAAIRALPEDERATRTMALPHTSRILKLFGYSTED